ncbi:MAG: peptide ABC transporter substrate-binding protein [Candidatus Tectomicrobia bacterium]|uniref:Peptide ABC transporter substrate-binding protein n=1 Tax=Tectimicrobiota bacterium TaxID=2528274 RepID=A0A932ZWI3_UNCTE|nr:peptide ABC transporter substrate-binding protein [Candidatus Tectomicrobia bacterium]
MVKRLLLFLPLAVSALLLQSYFWVPTFSVQVKGSEARLRQFINASTGDAQILNPILLTDAASGDIADMVFNGLIDRDEDLNYRGRLATSWEIYEEAFFVPRPGGPSAGALRERIEGARAAGQPEWAWNVTQVEVIPPAEVKASVAVPKRGQQGFDQISFTVAYPERVKITLKEVDQDLFDRLKALLGADAFATDPAPYLTGAPAGLARSQSLAEVQLAEHNPVIVFHLRKGVLFHDGHEFDSGDVRFTYDAIMNPANLSPRTADYEPVKRVETPDRYTVRVVYKRLYSPAFGTWGMGMLPEHLLNAEALAGEARRLKRDPQKFTLRDSGFNRSPIGTGPFRFKEWRSDEVIRLVRFEKYWEGPPQYAEYVSRILPDALTQELAFYSGTVDSYTAGVHQVERLRKDPRFQVFSGLAFGYTYIGYNLRREPFGDVRVRRALTMAVNTRQIQEFLLYGEAEDITGPFVKQSDHYNRSVKPLPHDPQAAERLLHEAGWRKVNGVMRKDGKPLQFTLVTNHGNEVRKAIAVAVQDAWKKIGVEVKVDMVEWAVFIQKYINTLNYDAVILGWRMGLDPDLYQIWHSSQTGSGQLNFVGYQNPEADRLIIKIRQEYNKERQVAYAHQLHRIIYGDQPYTFLYVGKATGLLDRKIAIAEQDKSGKTRYRKITATKTGNYTFYFNKWLKLPGVPQFEG